MVAGSCALLDDLRAVSVPVEFDCQFNRSAEQQIAALPRADLKFPENLDNPHADQRSDQTHQLDVAVPNQN